jgi:hypothetical protein
VPVLHATYELALRLLRDSAAGTDTLADDGLSRFKRAKVGPLEVEVNQSESSGTVPDHVLRILRHLLRRAAFMAKLERA